MTTGRNTVGTYLSVGWPVWAYFVLASLWIFGSDQVALWLGLDREALASLQTVKGFVFVVITTVLLQWLLSSTSSRATIKTVIPWGDWLLIFLLILLCSFATQKFFARVRGEEINTQLKSIVGLKSRLISEWLKLQVREADTAVGLEINQAYRAWASRPDYKSWKFFLDELWDLQEQSGFQAVSFSRRGQILWSLPQLSQDQPSDPVWQELLNRPDKYRLALDRGQAEDVRLLIPVVLDREAQACLLLRSRSSDKLLQPLLTWPDVGIDSQILLVRTERGGVRYLSSSDSQQTGLKLSNSQASALAVQLAYNPRGAGHLLQGSDEKGLPSLGWGYAVAGTDWFVLGQMKRQDYVRQCQAFTFWIWLAALLGLLVCATFVLYQRQKHILGLTAVEHRSQQEKLEALQLLKSLADSTEEVIATKDLQGNFTFYNRAGQLSLGKKIEEIIGQDTVTVHGQRAEALLANDRQVMRQRSSLVFIEEIDTVDGPRTFQTTKGPLLGSNAQVIGTYMVARDITKRLQAQKDLDSQIEARLRAETASLAKSMFLANMSHEIRTPLNAVIGLTYLLLQEELNTNSRAWMLKVQQASQHLLGLIDDLLDFSKIETGHLVLESSDFQLGNLLQEVRELITDSVEKQGLTLEIECGAAKRWLRADVVRLRQILLNLTSNAVKFTDQGTIVVRAMLPEAEHEPMLLRLEVEDSGIGIEPALQERIFDFFEQVDTSTTRQHGGTGLGLAINRELVRLMGGEIGVTSEPGKGSLFWLTVPVEPGYRPAIEPLNLSHQQDAAKLLRQGCYNLPILLAEDHPVNREVAVALLQAVGLKVVVAEDGLQALELAEEGEFALALLDLQMPNLDGLGVARALRQRQNWQERPLIAMTANALLDVRQQCLAAGMSDFISKPVDPQQLYAILWRWLSGSPQTQLAALDNVVMPAKADSPVLDFQAGLARVNGDSKLYAKLLEQLLVEIVADFKLWEVQIKTEDWEALCQGSHRQKGAAANLGLMLLAQTASLLENRARERSTEDCLLALESLQEVYQQTRQSVDKRCQKQVEVGSSHTGTVERSELFNNLREQLRHSESQALDTLELLKVKRPEYQEQEWRQLEELINDFEFEQALSLLERIKIE